MVRRDTWYAACIPSKLSLDPPTLINGTKLNSRPVPTVEETVPYQSSLVPEQLHVIKLFTWGAY